MNSKQYTSAPEVLPESERINKKARFETSQGNFTIALFGEKTPKTVSNFIFLAKEGFYDGLTFHRVIDEFMIQGGDPKGDGTGGPGYQFEDEFDSSLTFSKVGLLAMANSGANTNGSQFFITVAPTEHLNGKHTIFGEIIEGYDIVEKISKVTTGEGDKPQEPVVINKIETE
ncbi:MAG: peptidylprolyl isomerase [Candidatus Woykebacteria bacterium RBG_13_40_7b]|uniref:Peptidyl-prolyl cis-trans isomerase n=1 Tax=Candidatus Woykebacteria bacterium RBG_13_40_7b TaxID=1802594 RepID=A0A1G1W810_9BACT|nr:MAG: peptidylprolyl isomerase [Candidatus Woykebacteria bacterium RBG_13_40_7b]